MPFSCFHCRNEVTLAVGASVGFRETCPSCSTDLHICRNCSFYDESSYHECREPQAEWVKEKERWNRCEYFRPSGNAGGASEKAADALAALDALFKK